MANVSDLEVGVSNLVHKILGNSNDIHNMYISTGLQLYGLLMDDHTALFHATFTALMKEF